MSKSFMNDAMIGVFDEQTKLISYIARDRSYIYEGPMTTDKLNINIDFFEPFVVGDGPYHIMTFDDSVVIFHETRLCEILPLQEWNEWFEANHTLDAEGNPDFDELHFKLRFCR